MTATAPELLETSHSAHLAYRPSIDGLRAIAVLSVFVFHLNRDWLPGGFVGVDIFFVISGFLITSIIQKDCIEGRFSLVRFYQRRIARIFPAFFTVALATIAAASFIYTSHDLAWAGGSLFAAALSIANIRYALQGNYFEMSADAQPYLHYWSLSVEEQFYIVYPLFLALLFKYMRRYRVVVLALLWIVSFTACVIVTRWRPAWAFYLLPTRAWQLLAGCILAVAMHGVQLPNRAWLRWASITGLGLIAASFILIHEGPQFPGIWALLPIAGSVAVLLPVTSTQSRGERWLEHRALVLIGRLSYSLYLWHWPVFSFVDYSLFLEAESLRLFLKIVLSAILTALSYWWIEYPTRNFLNRAQSMKLAYGALIAVLAICAPLGMTIRRTNYINARPSDVARGGLEYGGDANGPCVVLMGDSHGSMYGKTIKEICQELGYRFVSISVAAGDPLPFSDGKPNQLWSDTLSVIRTRRPDVLVIACAWNSKLRDDNDRLAIAADDLSPLVKRLIILNQPPILPSHANRASIRAGTRPPFSEDAEFGQQRRQANDHLSLVTGENRVVLDVAPRFQTTDGTIRFLDDNKYQLYHDRSHLSGYGVDELRPMLRQAIATP